MNKFLTIFNHSYLNKVRSKSFIISSLLLVVIIVVMSNFDKIKDAMESEKDKLALSTNNEYIFKNLKKSFVDQKMADQVKKTTMEQGKKYVEEDKVKYLLEVKVDNNDLKANVYTKNDLESEEINFIEANLSQIKVLEAIKKADINLQALNSSNNEKFMEIKKIHSQSVDRNVDEKTKNLNTIIVMMMISIIFYIILTYSNQIAFDVATEKTSRISEILITSVKPSIHVFAKILSTIFVAFTQLIIVILTFTFSYFVFDLSKLFDNFDLKYGPSTTRIIIFSLIYMILGLISYISLASILGSITKRMENIGQSLMPITIISMIAFYISIFSISNSDNLLVKVFSFIPLFSPIIMPMRLLSTNTPMLHIIIGLLITLIVTLYLIVKSIESYKYNILNTKGKKG